MTADPSVAYRASDTQTNPPSFGLDRIDRRNRPLSDSYTYSTTASNVQPDRASTISA